MFNKSYILFFLTSYISNASPYFPLGKFNGRCQYTLQHQTQQCDGELNISEGYLVVEDLVCREFTQLSASIFREIKENEFEWVAPSNRVTYGRGSCSANGCSFYLDNGTVRSLRSVTFSGKRMFLSESTNWINSDHKTFLDCEYSM